jgi:hypothetical protein
LRVRVTTAPPGEARRLTVEAPPAAVAGVFAAAPATPPSAAAEGKSAAKGYRADARGVAWRSAAGAPHEFADGDDPFPDGVADADDDRAAAPRLGPSKITT